MGEQQINVQRVWAKECIDCHSIRPTLAGQQKVNRILSAFMMLGH